MGPRFWDVRPLVSFSFFSVRFSSSPCYGQHCVLVPFPTFVSTFLSHFDYPACSTPFVSCESVHFPSPYLLSFRSFTARLSSFVRNPNSDTV
jgi:hypothetical protein